ncbi:hypothetical protein CsSME_00011794 [Camellia sinensis var. sinensis]
MDGGAGVPPGTRPETCRTCRGSGMINKSTGPFRVQITCSYCHGTGKIVKCTIFVDNSDAFLTYVLGICCAAIYFVEFNEMDYATNFCKSCNGEKTVRGPKTVKLDIMPAYSRAA